MASLRPKWPDAEAIFDPLRRTLRRSRGLRKCHRWLRDSLRSHERLMQVRLVPEDAFAAKLHDELVHLTATGNSKNLGEYFEFGVFNGTSLSCAYRVFHDLGLDHVRFFGFDSFEGLPAVAEHDDGGTWIPKQFSCPIDVAERLLTARGVDWNRVFLVKGFFAETLTPALIDEHGLRKAGVIMVDCDMYSSTVACLDFVEPLIRDQAVLIFDDWFSFGLAGRNLGEKRAFEEFLVRHPHLEAQPVGGYNAHSMVFRVRRKGESQATQAASRD